MQAEIWARTCPDDLAALCGVAMASDTVMPAHGTGAYECVEKRLSVGDVGMQLHAEDEPLRVSSTASAATSKTPTAEVRTSPTPSTCSPRPQHQPAPHRCPRHLRRWGLRRGHRPHGPSHQSGRHGRPRQLRRLVPQLPARQPGLAALTPGPAPPLHGPLADPQCRSRRRGAWGPQPGPPSTIFHTRVATWRLSRSSTFARSWPLMSRMRWSR